MGDIRSNTTRPGEPGSSDPSPQRTAAGERPQAGERAVDPLVEALRDVADKARPFLAGHLASVRRWDRARMLREGKELSHLVSRQVFNQIPGVSAIAALIVGGWVASTFTTSPVKATLARWGIIHGGRHVVSSPMHKFLSVVLPILVAAITAYVVQKIMKNVRERQMERNIVEVARLGKDVQAVVDEKLAILEKARDSGLLSPSEFLTKKASLYSTYARVAPSQIKELLIAKLG